MPEVVPPSNRHGRPPLPPWQKLSAVAIVQFKWPDLQRLKERAAEEGLSVSSYLRGLFFKDEQRARRRGEQQRKRA